MNNEDFRYFVACYREIASRQFEALVSEESGTATFNAAYRAMLDRCRTREVWEDNCCVKVIDKQAVLSDLWFSHIQNPHDAAVAMDNSVGFFIEAVLAHRRGDLNTAVQHMCRAIEMAGVSSGLHATSTVVDRGQEHRNRSRRGGIGKGDKKAAAIQHLKHLLSEKRPAAGWTDKEAHAAVCAEMADFVKGKGITTNVAAALTRWLKLDDVAEVGGWRSQA